MKCAYAVPMAAISLMLAMLAGAPSAQGQGIMGDVFAGKLINPEVGVFAWYDLTDAATGKKFFLRQAIVGEERVKLKKGYWLETEIIPQIGFPTVYKMLLTGPASDPKNVHKIIIKEEENPPQEIPVDTSAEGAGELPADKRESLGVEKIVTPDGEMEAEHFAVAGPDGARTELWLKDDIRPMGIVRMTSPEGELLLRRHGKGGKDAESVLPKSVPKDAAKEPKTDVKVRVEGATEINSRDKKEKP